MKKVILGDTHGRSLWKLIVHQEQPDEVVFIGDYFDSKEGFTAAEQIHNFKEIVNYKLSNPQIKVILLLGNHDLSYYPGIHGSVVSGYQFGAAPAITQALMENIEHFQLAYDDGTYLYSHAGVGKVWLEETGWDGKENIADYVNSVWKYRPLAFEFYGFESTGDSTTQTPVWIRPNSLLKTWHRNKSKPTQIVGHTSVHKIALEEYEKWTGGKLIMIDALGTSGEYLVINDGVMSVGQTR